MSFKQTVNPNLDPVVYVNGKVLLQWREWCLACVRSAFGAPYSGQNAWEGWTKFTKFQHPDRNFPVGVYFPIWFSGYGGLGHVAFAYMNANGSLNIWTSPWEYNKPYFDTYESVDRLAAAYHVQFAGWSEDIAGMRVIEPVADPVPQPPVTPAPAPAAPADNPFARFPSPMNLVANKQPTRTWDLSATTWTGFKDDKDLDQGTPFVAVGKYKHSLGGVYFMDEASFGQADETKRPNAFEGINTVDLSPAPAPATPVEPAPQAPVEPAAAEEQPADKPKTWRDSFNDSPGDFRAVKDATIHDLEAVHPDQTLGHDQKVSVAGTVTGPDELEYYVTKKSHAGNVWYGIPKSVLVPFATAKVISDVRPSKTRRIFDEIDKVVEELNRDPEFSKFKQTLTPRGKAVVAVAEVEEKVDSIVQKFSFFKKKNK